MFPESIGRSHYLLFTFFFNDTATTEIYTLSLHDALPIYEEIISFFLGHRPLNRTLCPEPTAGFQEQSQHGGRWLFGLDRKSTRLNSSHANISYAVFCLKKNRLIFMAHDPPPDTHRHPTPD